MPRRFALLCLLSTLALGGCAGSGFWRGWQIHSVPQVIAEEELGRVAKVSPTTESEPEVEVRRPHWSISYASQSDRPDTSAQIQQAKF